MRTFKYKTLGGLLKQVGGRYLTFYDFHSGRMYHKTHGWVRFGLSDEARSEAAKKFAEVVWAKATPDRIARCFYYRGEMCGILERLWIDKSGRAQYCAGQDYPSEIRTLQYLMR